MSVCGKILFFLFFFTTLSAHAALPTTERLPASGGAPLDILGSEPTGFLAVTAGDFKNKVLLTWSGSTLTVIDLETWAEAETQPDVFTASIADVALLGDGVTVVVALSSGDVATIDLSDETTFVNTEEPSDDEEAADPDSRQINASEDMESAGLSAIATSPDANSDTVYLIDSDSGTFYELDLSSESLKSVNFASEDNDGDFSDDYTPTDIAFADTDGGKILITTSSGVVLLGTAGAFTFSEIELDVREDDTDAPNLEKIGITPDQDFAYILDTDNDVIWAFGFSSADFVDQISTGTDLDPIAFDSSTENSALTDLGFLTDDDTTYGYATGTSGVSIFDASSPGSKAASKLIDTDTSTADIAEPVTLSATASQIVALSTETGTLITANGDASLSVVSDNPFITLSAVSTDAVTLAAPTFSVTFQTDETGTYTVVADSDPLAASGTELIGSTAVDTADTDITTAEININDFERETFTEGNNKIFVFVTDADGNTGWDAIWVNIDRPPDAITIRDAHFGDQKIFVDFVASDDSDISHYTVLAEPAEDQTNPDCPGSLTFASDGVITADLEASTCTTGENCSGTLSGLANAVAYCLAMTATDASDQTSDLSTLASAVTPEATVGPAEFLGQTGCGLTTQQQTGKSVWEGLSLLILLPLFVLSKVKRRARGQRVWSVTPCTRIALLTFLFVIPTKNISAAERTPQNWTFEVRMQNWFPTRSEIKPFFSGCCNLGGELEFGWLPVNNQINLTVGAGIAHHTGPAVGEDSGTDSGETFKMLTFPLHADVIYRFDYNEDQLFTPFVRAGLDSIIFRESGAGNTLWANRFGFHAGAGLGVLLDHFESLDTAFEGEMGVNDVYLTLEGRYSQIDSFGSTGMDFSGFYAAVGLLFEF